MVKLKPGLIIALSVRTEGGARNEIQDERSKTTPDGALVKEWKGRKIIEDPAEFQRATEIRSKARGLIRGCCVPTPFNVLMCAAGGPEEAKLITRIEEAERLIEQFNLFSNHSKLRLNMIRGEVAQTDEEAAAAIRSELTGILGDMQAAIKSADPKAMRDAASRGAQLGKLMAEKTRGKALLTGALKTTRAIASQVAKAGEDAEAVALAIADEKASPVSLARFAFAGQGEDLGEEEAPASDPVTAELQERAKKQGGATFEDLWEVVHKHQDPNDPGLAEDDLLDEPAAQEPVVDVLSTFEELYREPKGSITAEDLSRLQAAAGALTEEEGGVA